MRFKYTIIISIILLLFGFNNVSAENKNVNLYYFHAEGCSTCALETLYLEEIKAKDPNIVVYIYELALNEE